ncbi:MAG: hypothetical protein AAF957_17145 [Planctomycetota bacterium]
MPELLKGLLVALGASVFTLVAHGLFVASPPSNAQEPARVRVDTSSRVDALLARVEALLDREETQLAAPRPESAFPARARVPAGPEDTLVESGEILERLAAIERALQRRPPSADVHERLNRLHGPDVAAIKAAIDLRAIDREAADSNLTMRTMGEIVELFGYPSKTDACANRCDLYWRYDLPSAHPENPNYFTVYFIGGRSVWVECRWTD